VKAKLKNIEIVLISMVLILNAYLVHLNLVVNNYESERKNISTANYIEVEDIKEETNDDIEIVEEVEETKVYDGKTLNELSETIEKSLNSTISGKGYLIASYSLEKSVDPYMATAIMLHETGCKWGCSRLVNECNNVGGQKGKGCGSYAYFNSLDEGIKAFIDNLYRNYISYGLTTPEQINPKYAEDPNWAVNVNKYIENIKAQ
jgi:archaellum component FlaF (FlaF/FlaG flagellin family)